MLGRELSSGTQAIAPPPHQQEFKHFYELPMMKNCEIPQRTSKCPYSAEKKKKRRRAALIRVQRPTSPTPRTLCSRSLRLSHPQRLLFPPSLALPSDTSQKRILPTALGTRIF